MQIATTIEGSIPGKHKAAYSFRLILLSIVMLACVLCGYVVESYPKGTPNKQATIITLSDLLINAKPIDSEDQPEKTLDDLMHERLEKEKIRLGANNRPEILRLEANYIRTSSSSPDVVLYESSFHLEPRYMSLSILGKDTTTANKPVANQPVMYFLGSARTPLALPMVSNLSEALHGDAASYTVNIGILPLPRSSQKEDTIRYYVIIERAIESNRTESVVKIERFAKEFGVRISEPVQLQLENAPPERQTYVKLEDGSILKFYEDFARYFNEHILLNGERLAFKAGKAEISPISSKLSIPYTVGQNTRVKIELLSVVDSTHPIVLIDTIRRPADYLAELDMKPFSDGPYLYRYTAFDPATEKVVFSDKRMFTKSSPVMVETKDNLHRPDTLVVGGKREDAMALYRRMNERLQFVEAKSERLESSLKNAAQENIDLERLLKAKERNSIAGLKLRTGLGIGRSTGDNVFFGVEATNPSVALDVSFGYIYGSAPFIEYDRPANITKIFESPKSLGLQLTYIPVKLLDNLIEPYATMGYYGIWSGIDRKDALKNATLLVPGFGVASEPFGENQSAGFSLGIGEIIGIGVNHQAEFDVLFKAYLRF